jgi:predicted secreted protein
VVTVQGTHISAGEVEHWSAVKQAEARLTGGSVPGSSGPPAKQSALAYLITALWLQKEAAAQGIHVTDAQAQATYNQLLQSQAGAGISRQMQQLGLTPADERYRLRIEQLSLRLRAKIAGTSAGAGQARRLQTVEAFAAGFRSRWKPLTSCAAGYVVAECANGPPQASSG